MVDTQIPQRTYLKLVETPASLLSLQGFLLDKQAANLSPRTIEYYRDKLTPFVDYLLSGQGVSDVDAITANHVRGFLVSLSNPQRTPGGVHAYYRAVKAWLRWLYAEGDIPQDIMVRVRPPKVPHQILEPVSLETVRAMLKTCERKTLTGSRDYAALLALLDTGLRASEFLALDVSDLNMASGAVVVRKGKGGKGRVVFLSPKTRAALLRYLRLRRIDSPALWLRRDGKRLKYSGLRDIVQRRAKAARVPPPTLHAFRRAYALLSLRAGADIITLSRLLGHSSLSVLERYLKQSQADLQAVHERTSPVTGLGL